VSFENVTVGGSETPRRAVLVDLKDIIEVYEAINLAWRVIPVLSRSEREQLRRLRDRLAPLYREALEAEAKRRADRERTTERRSARKMMTPGGAEADDWHVFLGGTP
jgi:hypothetical protein